MKITAGSVRVYTIMKGVSAFQLEIGGPDKVLNITAMLEASGRQYDSVHIAAALREMANQLDREPI